MTSTIQTPDLLDLWEELRAAKAAIVAVTNDATLSPAEYLAAMATHEAAWKAADRAIRAAHPMRTA